MLKIFEPLGVVEDAYHFLLECARMRDLEINRSTVDAINYKLGNTPKKQGKVQFLFVESAPRRRLQT